MESFALSDKSLKRRRRWHRAIGHQVKNVVLKSGSNRIPAAVCRRLA
jgi:hypothetical protein